MNESLALAQEWLEQLHHLADRGSETDASAKLAQVTVILGEARSKLEQAVADVDGAASGPHVTVERV